MLRRRIRILCRLRTTQSRAIDRLRQRLVTILELIREVEAERDELVAIKPQDRTSRKIVALCRIRGLGENFAAVLTREVFYRSFGNRRQIASYVGITPMPYQSGGMDRDRRISRARNPRARTTMIQSHGSGFATNPAASWQNGSASASDHCGLGTQAAHRALALRRNFPAGVEIRTETIVAVEIADGNIANGGTGNATVLVFGGTTPPRFRWVASRRGYASCMRHSGAGSLTGPTVCKVTQP